MNVIVPDDYPDLQKAIDAIPDGEYGDIYIREGEYIPPVPKWGTPRQNVMNSLKPNLYIHGDGMDKTIIKRSSIVDVNSYLDIIGSESGIPCHDIIIEDMFLDGMCGLNPLNQGGGCIVIGRNLPEEHKRIIIRRVGVANARSGIGGVNFKGTSWDDFGLKIENCYINNTWTHITCINSDYVKVTGNNLKNSGGDAIFPQTRAAGIESCNHWIISDNDILNAGDTAIDITTRTTDGNPHTNMVVRNNKITNGHMRIAHAEDIWIEYNILRPGTGYKSYIGIDTAQGYNSRIYVNDNNIESIRRGIIFTTAKDSECKRNKIKFLAPYENQVGIVIGLLGTSFVEDNIIEDSSIDGMNFANWGIGSDITSLLIKNNKITNFGRYGIWDNNKNQSRIMIDNNMFYSLAAIWAIFTEYANVWTIKNNKTTVGEMTGNNTINAVGSFILDNTSYEEVIATVLIKNEKSDDLIVIKVKEVVITIPSGQEAEISVSADEKLVFR